jgi:hypothetical protein
MPTRQKKLLRERADKGDEGPPLSAAWRREIERRIKDSDDPRRYIVKSVLLPGPPRRWELYYNISDDVWAMDLSDATLFKRRRAAKLVAEMLGDRCRVEEVKISKSGRISRQRKPKKT